MHVLKRPKVIELGIPKHTLAGAHFCNLLEIQMMHFNGQWKVEETVATVRTIARHG